MGWHCMRCGCGGTGKPMQCCPEPDTIEPINPPEAALVADAAAEETQAAYDRGFSRGQNSIDCTGARMDLLARALFETDPEVTAFLKVVDDCEAPPVDHGRGEVDWGARGTSIMNRYGRALRIAWERDEHGWATRAKARAEAIDYCSVIRAWEGFETAPTGSADR